MVAPYLGSRSRRRAWLVATKPGSFGGAIPHRRRKTYKVWFRMVVPRWSDGSRQRTQCPIQMAALSAIPIAPMNPLNPSTIQVSRLGDRAARLTFADAASVSRASAIR